MKKKGTLNMKEGGIMKNKRIFNVFAIFMSALLIFSGSAVAAPPPLVTVTTGGDEVITFRDFVAPGVACQPTSITVTPDTATVIHENPSHYWVLRNDTGNRTINITTEFTAVAERNVTLTATSAVDQNITGSAALDITMEERGIISGRVICHAGYPVADASVSVWNPVTRAKGWARTDHDGYYTITGLAAAIYEMRIHPPPWRVNLSPAYISDIAVTADEITTVDITLEVQYCFIPERLLYARERAIVDITREVQYCLRTKALIYARERTIVDVTLEKGGIISGRVTCPAKHPVANALIFVWDPASWAHGWASTGADGYFTITGLATGIYKMRVRPPGEVDLAPAFITDIAVTAGETTILNITLQEGGVILGRITCYAGHPVAHASIFVWDLVDPAHYMWWWGWWGGWASTDADGFFAITGLGAGIYEMRVHPPGGLDLAPAFITDIAVTAGETTIVDSTLEKGGIISGRVACSAGHPVAHASIFVWDPAHYPYMMWWWGWWAGASTDADGYFAITGLAAGTYEMSVHPPGGFHMAPAFITDIAVTAGETTIVDSTLEKGGIILGRVICYAGYPVAYAWVRVWDPADYPRPYEWWWWCCWWCWWWGGPGAQADADGYFIITGLAAGIYDMRVRSPWGVDLLAPAFITDIAVTAGETTIVDSTLEKGGIISGRVTCHAGDPVASAWVAVWDPAHYPHAHVWWWWGPGVHGAHADADGYFTITGLATGIYKMRVHAPWELDLAPAFITDIIVGDMPVQPITARINNYTVSPRNIVVGEKVTIGFTFTNTGDVSHTFGAGATLRKPDGTRIDFLKPVTVAPGESGGAEWTHTIDMAGRWDVVFGVWEESIHPLRTLLVQTGWVPAYIAAREEGPGIVAARIDEHTVYPTVAAVGDKVTIGFTFTNTFDVSHTFGAGATLRRPGGERIDFLTPVTLAPGQSGSAQWTHTIDMIGRWDIVFGVWEEYTPPLQNLLVQTGWVPESIIATIGEEHNAPPRAGFTYVVDGLTVRFTSTSTDPDDNIISYHWKFGDGRTSGERNPTHTYTGAFTYTVVHTVVDAYGRSASHTERVLVLGRIAAVLYPSSVFRGVPLFIAVRTWEEELPVTVCIGQITESGTTIGITCPWTGLTVIGIVFAIDTSGFSIGRHELTIDVGGEIYKSKVVIYPEGYLVRWRLEALVEAVAEELREISGYPAGALARTILAEVADKAADEIAEHISGKLAPKFQGLMPKLLKTLYVREREEIDRAMADFLEPLIEKIVGRIAQAAIEKGLGRFALGPLTEVVREATFSILCSCEMQAITEENERRRETILTRDLSKADMEELLQRLWIGKQAIRNTRHASIYHITIPLPDIGQITAKPTMCWFKEQHRRSLYPVRLRGLICPDWARDMIVACSKSLLTIFVHPKVGWIDAAPHDELIEVLEREEIRPLIGCLIIIGAVVKFVVPAVKAGIKLLAKPAKKIAPKVPKVAKTYTKFAEKVAAVSPYVITAGMFVSVDILADRVKEKHGEIMAAIDHILNRGAATAFARPLFLEGELRVFQRDIILTLTPTGKIVGFDFVEEGERLRVPPEYRLISLGARESFRIAAQETPQITMQLAPERETFELGETARITVTMRNEMYEPLEGLLLWFFVPEEDILIGETINLEAHSEVVWYHEFEVTHRMVYAPMALLTLFDRIIAEDVTSFVVGGVKQRRAFMTIDYAEFSDPGLIEMKVRVENVGNIAINPYLAFGGTFGDWTIELPEILPQTSITETVSFRINDPGIYTAYFILTEGAKTLHARQVGFTVRAIDTLLASVSTDRVIYNLGDTVQVSVVVENVVFQVVDVPYELEIITPSGQVINVLTFVAQEAGTYIVRVTPIAEGHAIVSDETLFIVERQSDLIIEASLEEKALLVRITTDAGGPVGGVRVTANNLMRVTDKEGRAKFEYLGIEEPFLRAERVGFNPAMVTIAEPPAPAEFTITDLTITPEEVYPGEEVTISVLVTNIGDLRCTHEVVLEIDNAVEATYEVTLDGGISQQVSFTVIRDVVATYAVNIDGLTGTFEVMQEPPPIQGDVNRDGRVDAADLALVAAALNSRPGMLNWNHDADLNQDGIVDIFDLVLVGLNFGKSSSPGD